MSNPAGVFLFTILEYFKSSVGRKAIMAVTGLLLFGFVIIHMLGNLQIYLGQDALNDYAKHINEMPLLLWPARIFLLSSGGKCAR